MSIHLSCQHIIILVLVYYDNAFMANAILLFKQEDHPINSSLFFPLLSHTDFHLLCI